MGFSGLAYALELPQSQVLIEAAPSDAGAVEQQVVPHGHGANRVKTKSCPFTRASWHAKQV